MNLGRGLIPVILFTAFSVSASAASDSGALLTFKNNLTRDQELTLEYWDASADDFKQVSFVGEESFELRLHTEGGRVNALELRHPGEASGQILARDQEAGFSRCLQFLRDFKFLCISVSDLPTGGDPTSAMRISVLPSWARYTQPIPYDFEVQWNDQKIPVAIKAVKDEHLLSVDTLHLGIQAGWFFKGIYQIEKEFANESPIALKP
jgi:hypothetical protein